MSHAEDNEVVLVGNPTYAFVFDFQEAAEDVADWALIEARKDEERIPAEDVLSRLGL